MLRKMCFYCLLITLLFSCTPNMLRELSGVPFQERLNALDKHIEYFSQNIGIGENVINTRLSIANWDGEVGIINKTESTSASGSYSVYYLGYVREFSKKTIATISCRNGSVIRVTRY